MVRFRKIFRQSLYHVMNVLKDVMFGMHATKIVLFVERRRSCRTDESGVNGRLGERVESVRLPELRQRFPW